jgi:hypothetical protein
MLKYARIINKDTKEVSVFLGTDIEWAISGGFSEQDVEQAYNGAWYLQGYAPEKPAPTHEEISALREQAYISEIDTLHAQRQRKTILGTWTEEDEAEYIAQVKARSEDIANRYPYGEEE